ncbi:uncharacterized protein SPSK_10204 [Sporothrix schenckii 1099-18]|uniref:Uncharacterized protein n=1 Tax=Sporothrix schenckii 1099-18 TaxID=1397361 RepID=A0A0F2M769_SPOSC|nr:uncharacterized protein SPSK_10204 [Sporothrix schenckii 1099-18]KJR84675.1 hypothetical protein SPSK_10204 [Sporothrix schenckii 1099-18]
MQNSVGTGGCLERRSENGEIIQVVQAGVDREWKDTDGSKAAKKRKRKEIIEKTTYMINKRKFGIRRDGGSKMKG